MKFALLEEVCNIQMGQSPAGNTYNEEKIGLPLLGGASDFGILYPDAQKFTTDPKKVANKDDLILCIRATIGNRNFADQKYCLGRGVAGLRPQPNKLDSQYLWHWLELGKNQLLKQAKGSTFKQVTRDAIQSLKIPLPPIDEQRRIASILDKADEIRRKRQEAIKLTEELGRSLFLDMFGDPITNSKNLKVQSLGDIANFIGGGTPSRKKEKYFQGQICWASSKDMRSDTLLDTQEHITQEAIDNSSTKLVKAGSLLVVVKSKILMRYLPVVRTMVDTCFNQDIKAIMLQDPSFTIYLHTHLKLGQETLLRQARGVNTEGLTLEHLKKYSVLIPEKKELDRFVDLYQKLEKIVLQKREFSQESKNLFNSLLQRAFKGEL